MKMVSYVVLFLQKDFIDVDGPMLVKGGKAIVPNVIEAVQIARQRGILVVWVRRTILPIPSFSFSVEFLLHHTMKRTIPRILYTK